MASACPKFTVRKATRADLLMMKKLTDEEKWDMSLTFFNIMYDLDDRAWFVAEADSGEIIGVRALGYCNESITSGGIYVVKKSCRGHGVGHAVNVAALKSVGNSNIILSATNVDLYNTHGFTFDFDIHQKRLNVGTLLESLPVCQYGENVTIFPYATDMLAQVIRYDAEICLHDRSGYVENWNIQTSEHVLVAFSENTNITGYACLRMTEYGYEIAPLYADTKTIAWSLLRGLLYKVDQSKIIDLLVCSKNENVMDLLKNLPQENMMTHYKMYNRSRVEMSLQKVFSLSALSFSVV